jgi:hypothetical protein
MLRRLHKRTQHVLLLLLGAFASTAAAQDPAPATHAPATESAGSASLVRRLRTLSEAELDATAARALEQARRALEAAQQARQAGKAEQAQHAERLADAALTLSERQLALHREQALLRASSERVKATRERLKSAREALEKERARASELTPPVPAAGAATP